MESDFLELQGKKVLVCGVANRRSVAFHVGRVLAEVGADVLYSVKDESIRQSVENLLSPAPIYVCDVEKQEQIDALADRVRRDHRQIHGFVHSIAYADYSAGWRPFHETPREAFLQAADISCFSLIALSNALKEVIEPEQGSVVAMSISTTRMAAENYGYMGPIKAALDSSICFLAKSFSRFSNVRFNAVCAGPLKTSASAGIPGFVESYLYAEKATLRKKAVQTEEVANVVAFLLSPRSSAINAQGIVVDAGMSVNYFDEELIRRTEPQDR